MKTASSRTSPEPHVPGMRAPLPAKIALTAIVERLSERLQPESGDGFTHALLETDWRDQRRERYDLDDRRLHLTASLVPTPFPGNPLLRKRAATPLETALDEMLLALRKGAGTTLDDESSAILYAEAMGGEVPMWAAERAAIRARKGDLGAYHPGTGALIQLAQSYLVPVRAELEAIERILDARVVVVEPAVRHEGRKRDIEAVRKILAEARAHAATYVPPHMRQSARQSTAVSA